MLAWSGVLSLPLARNKRFFVAFSGMLWLTLGFCAKPWGMELWPNSVLFTALFPVTLPPTLKHFLKPGSPRETPTGAISANDADAMRYRRLSLCCFLRTHDAGDEALSGFSDRDGVFRVAHRPRRGSRFFVNRASGTRGSRLQSKELWMRCTGFWRSFSEFLWPLRRG